MSISIRLAQITDLDACLQLLSQLGQPGSTNHPRAGMVFEQLLSQQRGSVLVAEVDGTVLGMASVSYNMAMRYGGEYCQLEELIVDPQARGKNLGGLLVEHAVTQARARESGEMGLYLVEHTEHNAPFYEKYGFKLVGSEMRQTL